MPRINYLAVAVAVVLQQAWGFAVYSPALFGDAWLAGIGKTPDQIDPSDPVPFIIAIVASVAFCLWLAWLFRALKVETVGRGMTLALGLAVVVLVPAVWMHEAFQGRPPVVLAIDAAMELGRALIAGLVLSAWRPKPAAGAPLAAA